MERDLCYLMANGGYDDCQPDYSSDDGNSSREFGSRDLGTALTFGEMIAEEELLSDLMDVQDPEELLEAMEAEQTKNKVQHVSLKNRDKVLAFEQYVYAKCGITR